MNQPVEFLQDICMFNQDGRPWQSIKQDLCKVQVTSLNLQCFTK